MDSAVWLDVMCCPRCHGALTENRRILCSTCGEVGRRVSRTVVDFLQTPCENAEAVNAWSDEFVLGLPVLFEQYLTADKRGAGFDSSALRIHGLVGSGGRLTPLGDLLKYQIYDAYRWNVGRKGLDGVLELSAIGSTVRILDVGTGACQTLRLLEPDRPVTLFGVDIDLTPLVVGGRLALNEGIDLALARASATAMPYRDGAFDLLISRVALNYMHQQTALAEMSRVLRPGGFLFCRVENIWFDLWKLKRPRSAKALLAGLRNLGWGGLHAATGWQPIPGDRYRGNRTFVSTHRMRLILAKLGCEILHAEPSHGSPTIAGRHDQLTFVARKRHALSETRAGSLYLGHSASQSDERDS
jgi:SAM-dependent methyltransferase